MVGSLLRLTLALHRNQLKRSVWAIVGLIAGLVYALGLSALVVSAMVALRLSGDIELARFAVVVAGTCAALVWGLLPALLTGADQTLDPSRFATYSVPRRELITGLGLGSLVGPAGIGGTIICLALAIPGTRSAGSAVLAVLGSLLAIATTVLFSRALVTWLAGVLSSRRFKDVSGLIIVLPLMALGPIMSGAGALFSDIVALRALNAIAGFTPFGAPWALPYDLLARDWAALALHLAIVLLWGALCAWWWNAGLARELSTVRLDGSASGAGAGASMGESRILRRASTPMTAMMTRSFLYWYRDPRYLMALAVIPMFAGLILWQSLTSPGTWMGWYFSFFLLFFCSWGLAADTSYDSTAHAAHVLAGVKGLQERFARTVPYLVLSAAVLAALFALESRAEGLQRALPHVLLYAGVIGVTLGAASVVGTWIVIPVQRPHDNPMSTRKGGGAGAVVQLGGMAFVFLLAGVPGLIMSLQADQGHWGAVWGIAIGLIVLGAVALAAGLVISGRMWERRAPLLMEKLVAADHA